MWLFGRALAADDFEEVTVEADKAVDTATERSLDRAAIETFPAGSADELLRAMPGLHLSAHGGTGKAYQILLRGFDAAHGSDLAVFVEGVPLNEPSNVHGQGYLDLHFLPPVLVDGLDLTKGSYRAEDGDFAVTGAANYHVGLEPTGFKLETSLGTDRSGRGTFAWRPAGRGPGSFLVGEAQGAIGVGEGRRFHQLRLAGGVDGRVGQTDARAMLFLYGGAFESPGVLRFDDLQAGDIPFYGAYDEAGGGASSRVLAMGSFRTSFESGSLAGDAWVGARSLRLDQNFTGYLLDEVHGDGTRQSEVAADSGASVEGLRVFDPWGRPVVLRAGLETRAGRVEATEEGITPDGDPWSVRLDSTAHLLDVAGWSEARIAFGDRLTVVPGLRIDRVSLALRDTFGSETWARSDATVVSPKSSASLNVSRALTVFGAYGRGFRSPEARGIADGDRAPVMTSDSGEIGMVGTLGDTVSVSSTAFEIVISNELVFDHLVGRFLSAGRTVRAGIEGVVDFNPLPWLSVQGDVTYTDGRFAVDGTPIPYAPRWFGAAAVYVRRAPLARGVLSGGLRVWALGPRPLPSGFASRPALVGTLTGRLAGPRLTVGVEVDNLFGGRWRDGEFVFPSWFDRDEPRSERKTLHVTAGDPFALRLVLGTRPATTCRGPAATSCR